MVDELSGLYGAFLRGEADPLPKLSVQYADYAAWQRGWMAAGILQEQAAFWKKTLAGAPTLLELPTDHARPAQQDYAGGFTELEFDEKLTGNLQELSKLRGTTLYMTLLAGWAALLGRLSGQLEVVVGTPVANRARREIEGLIGFFVNTLALRVDLTGSPTVAELLGRVKGQALAAQEHQDIPFEQVVEILGPVRSLSHTPLFQVMFAWQNVPEGKLELPGLELKPLQVAEEVYAKFDLTLSLQETGERIVGGIKYATALFEQSTVDAMWVLALAAGGHGHHATRPIDRIEILPVSERRQLVEEWNATEAVYPDTECLPALFEASVRATPDAVAVVCDDESLTYRVLHAEALQLAGRLRDLGVRPETPWRSAWARGLCSDDRGAGHSVGGRGVSATRSQLSGDAAAGDGGGERAGGAADAGRVAGEITPAGRIVADSGSVEQLAGAGAGDAVGPGWVDGGLTPEHLGYVVYTSGSTGTPKGVMVSQRSVVNRLTWMQRGYGLGPGDTVLQKTPITFDVSVWELFWPVLVGARLVMARPEGHKDPAYLCDMIVRHGVTTVHFVPSMFELFLAEAASAGCTPLTHIVCSGEALPGRLVQQSQALLPQATVHNLYGPTEAAVDVTAWAGRAEAETAACRSDGRWPTFRSTSWIGTGSPRRWTLRASCTSAVCRWPGYLDDRRWLRSVLSAILLHGWQVGGCTGRGMWRGGDPTARSSFWGGRIFRSSCAVSASSWRRSKRSCGSMRRCRARWWWRARTCRATCVWLRTTRAARQRRR